MRIELKKPPKKEAPTPEVLTQEEVERREAEKAELLASLGTPARKRSKASEPTGVSFKEPEIQEGPQTTALEGPVVPQVPVHAVPDVTAATAERKQLEADLKALEGQLTAARLREKQAQQAAIVAQQQQTQAQGAKQLAPLQPLLQRHLAEVVRIQTKWGPTLKDFARSMPSDPDPVIRRQIGEIYRSAAPLGQKLGDARATLESALRGLTLATQSAQPHVHSQAATLAEAALSISVLALETEIKSLVELRDELRPGHVVHAVTADHIVAPSLAPRPHITSADFGPSLT